MGIFGSTFEDGLFLAFHKLRRNWEDDDLKRRLGAHLDTTDLEERTQKLLAIASFPTMADAMEAFYERLIKECHDKKIPYPVQPIREAMVTIYGELYADENLELKPLASVISGDIEAAKYRDRLFELSYKAADPAKTVSLFTDTVLNTFLEFARSLPSNAQMHTDEDEEPTTTLPLVDSLENIPHLVGSLVDDFLRRDLAEHSLFKDLQAKLLKNVESAEGPKNTTPYNFKGETPELLRAYLRDTSLARLFDARIPFAIPEATRFSGTWVVAPPNRGKTNLLLHQFEEDVQKDASIILMDSKGDLINPIRELESIRERLVILEPSQEFPLALNPLDLGASTTHTVELIEYIFRSLLDSTPTPLQGTLFRAILLALKQKPDANFADFRKILVDGWKAYEPYIRKLDDEDQDFFFKGEFDSRTYNETKAQLLWRIRDLTTRIPILRASFRAPKTLIDIGALMDGGKIIILDVRKQLLGESGCEFLGRLYIALVRAAADQRSGRAEKDKLPCYFYIDEAHTIIRNDEKLAGIIQECRSQKIAMILAHQAISQITSATTLGALSDCAIRMANSDEETSQLAPRLRATPETLRNLPIGSFATFVRDTTPKGAVTLKIPLSGVPRAPKMTNEARADLKARMRANYAYVAPSPEPSIKPTEVSDEIPQTTAEPVVVSPPESPVHAPADFEWPKG